VQTFGMEKMQTTVRHEARQRGTTTAWCLRFSLRRAPSCSRACPHPNLASATVNSSHCCHAVAARRVAGRRTRTQAGARCSTQPASSIATVVKAASGREFRWSSILSRKEDMVEAVAECVGCCCQGLGDGAQPDLAFVHASSVHGDSFELVVPLLREALPSLRAVFGCSVGA
jgi:hypothetical protein